VAALELRLIGLVVALLGLGVGYAYWAHHERAIGAAAVQSRWDADRLAARETAVAESARQTAALAEVARLAALSHAREQADADAARGAADSLRVRFAALARACAASAAAGPGDAASGAAGVLTDVFGETAGLARRYAQIADERGNAGHACEQSYLKLTAP